MKQEKYNIRIKKEALRLNKAGEIANLKYPKAFGDKSKNNFILTKEENDNIFVIKTPEEKSVLDLYSKLEEILNVVYCESYEADELIWPYSNYEDLKMVNNVKISVDKEFYEEAKTLNKNLPETLEEAYKNLKENSKEVLPLIEDYFGKCKISVSKNSVQISNLRLNYKSRITITEDELYFLVALVFALLEKKEISSLAELKEALEKASKLYYLKAEEAIQNVISNLKLEDESKISDSKKLKLTEKYMKEGYNQRYSVKSYPDIVAECAVIIKDAIKLGIDYNVLNEEKSIVEFNLNGHKEFVIEGNKTNRDTYIFPIVTDDKFIAKTVMQKAGLNVPKAVLLEEGMDEEEILSITKDFFEKGLVVKPRNTNYGTGITVFAKKTPKEQVLNAISYAFKFDDNVLIEEYAKGMEYRFLVIDGKCLSVAHRRAASVVGDDVSTIEELINAKNKEPWHALTGTPVKKDKPVEEYLKTQNYTLESVIPEGKRVFLRTNSNCSTGGEAVDMTEIMPAKFKKIAEKAAKAFNGEICGVDIIINDLEKDEYSIIEINDNPGYSINEWPYEGKGEKIGTAILKMLGY